MQFKVDENLHEEVAALLRQHGHDQSRPSVVRIVARLIPLFATEALAGCLWIVDEIGMRVRNGRAK